MSFGTLTFRALALFNGLRKILDTWPTFKSFFLSQFILSAQLKEKKTLFSISLSSKFSHSKRKSIDLIKEKKSIEKSETHNLFKLTSYSLQGILRGIYSKHSGSRMIETDQNNDVISRVTAGLQKKNENGGRR